MKPGLHRDIPADLYHSDPCEVPSLSSSIAQLLVNDCPARAYHHHPRFGGYKKEATDEMNRGSIVHSMVLGAGKEYVELPFPDFRTKVAQQERDRILGLGQVPILEHKKRQLDYIVMGIVARLDDLGVSFKNGHKEAVLVWEETADDGTPVLCRGMLDHLALELDGDFAAVPPIITDLKTCESAHPRDCAKSCINYGYDIQWAAYTSACRKLWPESAGREKMRFVFCECDPPYICTVAAPGGSMRELGERKWRRAINLWAECTRNGIWPGYATEEARLVAPAWAMEET